MREMLGLPRGELSQSVVGSGYAKLECSLMSGLPNEVDFALNVLLLLSTDAGGYTLRGVRGTRVIDAMLAYVGINTDGEWCLLLVEACFSG